jgi:ABC-type nitrate/sulfonate/bicarbonate transport system permease component
MASTLAGDAASSRPRPRRAAARLFRSVGVTMLSLAVALAVWQVATMTIVNPLLLPPPTEVFRTALPMLKSGEILNDIAISLLRIAIGFVSGTILAIVVGVLMGRIQILNESLDPVIEVLRYLSPTAMIPIAIIWFGIGELSKYFLVFWATFFFVLINTIAGVRRTPLARQRAARCMGATRLQIFIRIVIPSSVPYIVTGMRVAMASAFMSIVPAEMLAADSGLGYLLQQSGVLMQTNRIFVALAAICLLGFVTDRTFQFLVDRTMSRYL